MFDRSVSARTTIIVGAAPALVVGLIVSIGVVRAAPGATTGPDVSTTVPATVPAAVAPAPANLATPAEGTSAAVGEVPDRGRGAALGFRGHPRMAIVPGPQNGAPLALMDDPFAPLDSPDVGDHCAAGLDAQDISDFFSRPIGDFQGADYQRALRLTDDRVLWTFQDAFIGGTLVHNVGMVQSGRCFTLLNDGARSWLLADQTADLRQWQWIIGGGISADGTRIHLFVVQMNETGGSYLSTARPTALRRVVLDAVTLEVVGVVDESTGGDDLYGWDVTSDATSTYLYSHCYQQFGDDTELGFGECAVDVKLARVPLGRFDAEREYWDGSGWNADPATAAPVVSSAFVGSGNNPAQISFDGTRFVLVQKRDDWWGTSVDFGVAGEPQGPFVHAASIDEPRNCEVWVCNTYFAAWVPWNDSSGHHIWSIGHNRWDGSATASHLDDYRPTFHTVELRNRFAPPRTLSSRG